MNLYIKSDDYGYLCYMGAQMVPFKYYQFGSELLPFLKEVVNGSFKEVVYLGEAEEGEAERNFG